MKIMSKIHVLETWWIHRLVILLLPGLNELHVGGATWRILNSTLRCHVRRRIRIPLNTKQEDITTFIKMNSFVSSGGKMLIYKKGSQISKFLYNLTLWTKDFVHLYWMYRSADANKAHTVSTVIQHCTNPVQAFLSCSNP